MDAKRIFSLSDILAIIFIICFLGIIIYGLVANNKINQENDIRLKQEILKVQSELEKYFVNNEVYPKDSDWKNVVKNDNISNLDYFDYDSNGAGAGCYTISFTLSSTKDSGPNIKNGVYTLECKQ